MIILDCETYKNYFLLSMLDTNSGKIKDFELYDNHPFDAKTVQTILRNHTTLGFNSLNYDLPVIVAALRGDTNAQIKQLSDDIIAGGFYSTKFAHQINTVFFLHIYTQTCN